MGGASVFILPPLTGALDLLHMKGEHEGFALFSSRNKGEAVGWGWVDSKKTFTTIFSTALSDPQLCSC